MANFPANQSQNFQNVPSASALGQRFLAAIVFTDVVSYSKRMATNETDTLLKLKDDREIMERLCRAYAGAVIKSTGDGLLMLFPGAEQAVLAAIEIQVELGTAKGDRPTDHDRLQHRIGIHLGDIYFKDGDILGNAVNIAARLESNAEPGGVCVSQDVYHAVRANLGVQFTVLPDVVLKNIGNFPVYRLRWEGVETAIQTHRDYYLGEVSNYLSPSVYADLQSSSPLFPLISPKPRTLKFDDWQRLFEQVQDDDFPTLHQAFLRAFKITFQQTFHEVQPDYPPLRNHQHIRDLLERYDHPELAVRFVEQLMAESPQSNLSDRCNLNNVNLNNVQHWETQIAAEHHVTLSPAQATPCQGYLLVSLKPSGRATKEGAFVTVFPELRVTGENDPIEFSAMPETCLFSEVAEYLSDLIPKAEAALIPYSSGKIILEIFLPCQHLEANIAEEWKVKNEQQRPRSLGTYRRFMVRSLERAMNPTTQAILRRNWHCLETYVENPIAAEKSFHTQQVCPQIGALEVQLVDKSGLKLVAPLPTAEEDREEILYDIINAAVPIALWSAEACPCTAEERLAEINALLQSTHLTNFAELAQDWSQRRLESDTLAIRHLRLLCDCPDRWPHLPDPSRDDDQLIAF